MNAQKLLRFLPIAAAAAALANPTISHAHQDRCPNDHANRTARYLHARTGDLLDIAIGDLRATQAVLGYHEVYYKLGRYQAGKDAMNKRFADWCEANGQGDVASVSGGARLDDPSTFTCTVPVGAETAETIDPMKTVVIGHGGRLYLVDGHHTFTSFLETTDGGPNLHVRTRVLANLSKLGPREFWRAMKAAGWVWLRDANNQRITVEQLPERLGLNQFQNDDYRALVYFTRDVAYAQNAANANYQEFHWGAWLRANPAFNLADYDLRDAAGYLAAVKKASELMSGLGDADVVDGDLTAGDLGRIDFNASEYLKVSKDYCASKPGKVAYALYYLHNILGIPPVVACP